MKRKTPGVAARGSVNHRADDTRTHSEIYAIPQRIIAVHWLRWPQIGGASEC